MLGAGNGPVAAPALLGQVWVPLDSSDDGFLAILALFGLGLYLIYDGFNKWKQLRLMQDTPTEKVRSAAVGRTELDGVCRPDGGTIEAPFTDEECVVATYEIEEWDDGDEDSSGHWDTIESGTLCTPFELDDGTGTMRVEPEEDATYEIGSRHRTRFRVGAGRTPPAEVVEFFDRQYEDDGGLFGLLGDGPSTRGSDKRRYTQEIIPPGEDLYLLGGTSPRADGGTNADRLVLGPDEGSDEFIISTLDEDELVSDYKWRAPAQIVGGLALSAVMLYFILTYLGLG